MGMFDDIQCDHYLPEEPTDGRRDFQSKDLDCLLDNYLITKGGRLVKRIGKSGAFVDTDYHGVLNFYTHTNAPGGRGFEWWEFNAEFVRGRLVKITGGKDKKKGGT